MGSLSSIRQAQDRLNQSYSKTPRFSFSPYFLSFLRVHVTSVAYFSFHRKAAKNAEIQEEMGKWRILRNVKKYISFFPSAFSVSPILLIFQEELPNFSSSQFPSLLVFSTLRVLGLLCGFLIIDHPPSKTILLSSLSSSSSQLLPPSPHLRQ